MSLGSGAYGAVDMFENRSPTAKGYERPVAVKRQKLSQSALKEQTVLRIASHPNVVPLIDTGVTIVPRAGKVEASGSTWMVMPLAQRPLDKATRGKGKFEVDDPIWVMYQIADAVGYLHEVLHIIHNDIKPPNILLLGDDTPLVADLGQVERIKCDPGQVTHTRPRMSLWWRAPEAILGSGVMDPKNDVWSLGVVFLEMVLKKYAFPADSEVDYIMRISGIWPADEQDRFFRKYNSTFKLNVIRSIFDYIPEGDLKLLIMSMLRLIPEDRAGMRDVLSSPVFADQRARRSPFFARPALAPTLGPRGCELAWAMVEPPPIPLEEANDRVLEDESYERNYFVDFYDQLRPLLATNLDRNFRIRMYLLLTYYLRLEWRLPKRKYFPLYANAFYYLATQLTRYPVSLDTDVGTDARVYIAIEDILKVLGFVSWTPDMSDFYQNSTNTHKVKPKDILEIMARGLGLELPTRRLLTLEGVDIPK